MRDTQRNYSTLNFFWALLLKIFGIVWKCNNLYILTRQHSPLEGTLPRVISSRICLMSSDLIPPCKHVFMHKSGSIWCICQFNSLIAPESHSYISAVSLLWENKRLQKYNCHILSHYNYNYKSIRDFIVTLIVKWKENDCNISPSPESTSYRIIFCCKDSCKHYSKFTLC